jgi:hypothetical protein
MDLADALLDRPLESIDHSLQAHPVPPIAWMGLVQRAFLVCEK